MEELGGKVTICLTSPVLPQNGFFQESLGEAPLGYLRHQGKKPKHPDPSSLSLEHSWSCPPAGPGKSLDSH